MQGADPRLRGKDRDSDSGDRRRRVRDACIRGADRGFRGRSSGLRGAGPCPCRADRGPRHDRLGLRHSEKGHRMRAPGPGFALVVLGLLIPAPAFATGQ